MDRQGSIEKKLAITYVVLTGLGAIAAITAGIAWGHWKNTLDQCVGRNCTCILYGEHTYTVFLGGDQAPCIWVTFGPLIYILFTIGLSCFHGYRVLFSATKTRTRTVLQKNDAGETIEVHTVQSQTTDPLPRAFWIVHSIITLVFTIYTVAHFAVFVDGYLRTCNQYKRTLEKYIGATGTALPVIHNRLSCISIFDFMDYMQPDTGRAYRDGFINTGIDLTIGIIASFFSWILFGFASILNIQMARIKE